MLAAVESFLDGLHHRGRGHRYKLSVYAPPPQFIWRSPTPRNVMVAEVGPSGGD